MDTQVRSELWMKGRRQHVSVPHENRPTIAHAKHFDICADGDNARRAYEYGFDIAARQFGRR